MSKWPKEWWKQITPKRGEIYWVNFSKLEEKDTSQGTEINGKTRPAVVISNNLQNEKGRRVVILPMSTTIDKYPYRFDLYVGKIINNYQESKVICEQVRSIDKRRLQNYAGKLSDQQLAEAESKLRRVLALEDIKRIIFTIFNK